MEQLTPRYVRRNPQVAGKGVLRQRACHHGNSPPVPPIDLRRSSIEPQIYTTTSSVLSIHLPIDGVALIEQLVERRQFESTSLTDRLEHQGLPLDWLQPVRRIPRSHNRRDGQGSRFIWAEGSVSELVGKAFGPQPPDLRGHVLLLPSRTAGHPLPMAGLFAPEPK